MVLARSYATTLREGETRGSGKQVRFEAPWTRWPQYRAAGAGRKAARRSSPRGSRHRTAVRQDAVHRKPVRSIRLHVDGHALLIGGLPWTAVG